MGNSKVLRGAGGEVPPVYSPKCELETYAVRNANQVSHFK